MSTSIWKHKRFALYATGATINNLGNAMFNLALPLLIYHMTHSAINMGIMAICQSLPQAILALLIGSIVDRSSRRVVMLSAFCVQALASSMIPVLNGMGLLENWMLYAVAVVISLGQAFLRTAEFAAVPAMFPDRKLEASAGLSSAFTVTTILGPILAGFLMGYLDYNALFWLNTASYFGPVILCLWTRIPHERIASGKGVKQVFGDMREGLLFVTREKIIVALFSVIAITVVADAGLLSLVLYHLKNTFALPDKTISWIVLAEGVGMFIASMIAPRFAGLPKGKLIFWSLVGSNLSVALFLIPTAYIVPVALFGYAMFGLVFGTACNVTLQEVVPNHMLGRVGGLNRTVNQVSLSLSTAMLTGITGFAGIYAAFLTAVLLGSLPLLIIVRGSMYSFRKPKLNRTETAEAAATRTA
jgi:MFS transporter, DHA3 family, macrolide efflux protein